MPRTTRPISCWVNANAAGARIKHNSKHNSTEIAANIFLFILSYLFFLQNLAVAQMNDYVAVTATLFAVAVALIGFFGRHWIPYVAAGFLVLAAHLYVWFSSTDDLRLRWGH